MACFHPIPAWKRDEGGSVSFHEVKCSREIQIPCGRCIGCRLSRTRSWAIRCMHESQMHRDNCFVTLTYDDAHYDPSLRYSDFQDFMRRFRRSLSKSGGRKSGRPEALRVSPDSVRNVRFFCAGEYGGLNFRPHFHALLFGVSFTDLVSIGDDLYRSKTLESLWPLGFSSVGSVTPRSAAYVAKYCCKKVTGPLAESHYSRLDLRTGEIIQVPPEFGRMSLKPGIGKPWFDKYWREVYLARDGVVLERGVTVKAPRAYDKWLGELDDDLRSEKDFDRYVGSKRFLEDCSPQRLAAREICATALANQRIRTRL